MQNTPDPRRWWALALLCAAQFIVILDTSIIGVALPTIQKGLGIQPSNLQWIFNAYAIAFGGLLLLGGRLSDLFGARRIFMLGFGVLSAASLMAGFAGSEAVLIAGRALQGAGAALIAPSALTLLMTLFGHSPSELGKAFGFWGAAAAAGGSAGVFLGGVITQWLSWEWTFFINVPVGLLAVAVSPLVLRRGAVRRGSIDMAGALAITASLVLAVYALVTAEQVGWTSAQTVSLLAVSAGLLAAFVVLQARRREPLMPLRIFKAPNLAAGNIVTALLAASWIPLWFFLNLYLQQVLHYDALEGGLALLPMTVAIMVLMVGVTGRVVRRFGMKPVLVFGLLMMAGALLLFARTPEYGSFIVHVLPASLLAAAGMSFAYIPATAASMSGARPEEMGLAAGIVNTSYQVGSALGLAAAVALSSGRALNDGFHAAFLFAALLSGLNAVFAVWQVRTRPEAAAVPSAEVAG